MQGSPSPFIISFRAGLPGGLSHYLIHRTGYLRTSEIKRKLCTGQREALWAVDVLPLTFSHRSFVTVTKAVLEISARVLQCHS